MLVNILILLFLSILIFQIVQYMGKSVEGMTSSSSPNSNNTTMYIPYDPSDATSPNSANNAALTLAQHNAQNITYLHNQLSDIAGLQSEVNTNSANISELQQQVQGLVQQQASYAQGISSVNSGGSKKDAANSAVAQENAMNSSANS